ncbi:MAG: dephospho-CoA kinase [Hyphomicrobiaceae bacterium]
MLIIGLTGSIGMGKSTVAKRFAANGIAVCDADAEVHKLYCAGGAAVAPIEDAFPGVTGPDGVERQKLAAALLADPAGFKRLEAIVHPLVHAAERDFLRAEAARGAEMAVLEIPLLLEGGGEKRVDVVVVVSAPAAVQRQRVLERPGMTSEKLEQILSRQVPDADKRRRADYIVDTGVAITETEAEVDRIVGVLRGRAGTAFTRCWA